MSKAGYVNFGVHLTLDGYGGDPEKLNRRELVYQALDELPEKLGMHKLSEPMVYEAGQCNPKDSGGFSGFVVIAESHISCHTFPYRGFVSIDVYTCKSEMDKEFVINYFKEIFGLKEVEINFIQRGTRFPAWDLFAKEDAAANELAFVQLPSSAMQRQPA
ncbi:adenosylmethionine decarboxylase [Candidatus Falkowbacteria bacterium]|nr:adenosylmethionine decarboxylase [Candidatus Falkowbacteria bacterium]